MRFTVDDGSIGYDMSDPRDHALGSWLTGDIGASFMSLLDVLSAVHDVETGVTGAAEMDAGGWHVVFTAARVEFTMESLDRRASYPLAEVKAAAEEYWSLVLRHWNTRDPEVTYHYRPDLPRAWAELLSWEETYGRHPYRGRLGIPEDGPA